MTGVDIDELFPGLALAQADIRAADIAGSVLPGYAISPSGTSRSSS